jgi:hypothetical protein
MSNFVASEHLPTYLLRELVSAVSKNGFPKDYVHGTCLYQTVRNIILAQTKSPEEIRDRSELLSNLMSIPLSEDDLQKVYSEIFSGSDINNPIVRKELVMYLLIREVEPNFPASPRLKSYLELFQN